MKAFVSCVQIKASANNYQSKCYCTESPIGWENYNQ